MVSIFKDTVVKIHFNSITPALVNARSQLILKFKKQVVDLIPDVQYAGEVLPSAWLTNHLLLIIHDQSAMARMPNKAGYLLTTGNYKFPVCLEKLYPSNRMVQYKRRDTA